MAADTRLAVLEAAHLRHHLAECEVWAEFRRVHHARARREWRKFQRDLAAMIVANLPGAYPPSRGVG